MPHSLLASLRVGDRALIKFDSTAKLDGAPGHANASVQGELCVRVTETAPGKAHVRLLWLSLGSNGPDSHAWKSGIGSFSVKGLAGEGDLTEDPAGTRLVLTLSSEAFYEAQIREEGASALAGGDFDGTPRERFRGSFDSRIEPAGEAKASWHIVAGTLSLESSETGAARLEHLEIQMDGSVVLKLPDTPVTRRLTLRRVRFKANPASSDVTGGSWIALLTAARSIWAKCCIDIEGLPPSEDVFVIDGSLMTSTDVGAIHQSFPSAPPRVINVGFVRSDLSSVVGGGCTFAACTGLDRVVISDLNAATNVNVLAHELGHALGLCHPSCGVVGFSPTSANSVMQEGSPNPARNTARNCGGIQNSPALETLASVPCTMLPDP